MDRYLKIVLKFLPVTARNFYERLQESDIGKRIAKGVFWSLTGSIISQGLMLLASIVVARILGKTEFGELGMIRSTVNMFAVFAGFGLGLTATKYIAEFRVKDKVKTGKIIGLTTLFASGTGGIIAFAMLIAAPFLAEKTINAPQLVNEIRLGALMLFFSALNGAQTGVLAGFEAFKTIAKVNFLAGALAFPIQIVFTLLFGLTGSVLGFGLNFFILCMLNVIAVNKESENFGVTVQFKNAWNEWPVLYKFSLPALLSGLMVSPVMWACNAMLVNRPNGYNEMAIFDAANQWRNIILFIPALLSQIVLPLLSGSVTNQNQFNRILKLNVGINFFISLLMASVISLFAGIFMKAYGSSFTEGKTVLIILTFTAVIIAINSVINQAIASRDQMWFGFLLNLIWSMALLISAKFLLNLGYGAEGLALAFLISYIIHTLSQFIFFKYVMQGVIKDLIK